MMRHKKDVDDVAVDDSDDDDDAIGSNVLESPDARLALCSPSHLMITPNIYSARVTEQEASKDVQVTRTLFWPIFSTSFFPIYFFLFFPDTDDCLDYNDADDDDADAQ